MNYTFRIPSNLLDQIHKDLSRPHQHAFERVGFIFCQVGQSNDDSIVIAQHYDPVRDDHYLVSNEVGALMGPDAIRLALQTAYKGAFAVFHVHRHDHVGIPRFSRVDLRESAKFIPDFWKVAPKRPHGTIVLSMDAATGMVWCPEARKQTPMSNIYSVGLTLARMGGHSGQSA